MFIVHKEQYCFRGMYVFQIRVTGFVCVCVCVLRVVCPECDSAVSRG